jgi:hypothetical protein
MASRREPEATPAPFRNMPMRQGEVRHRRRADPDRRLLLHQLPASRTSDRANAERRAGVKLADDVPNYPRHSGKFMWKLIAAWIAMGFRRPKIGWGKTVRTD